MMKCPYFSSTSPKFPRMKCYHFHSGMEWLSFSSREELHNWKHRFCDGKHSECPYFVSNVGMDTTFDNVWVVIVTLSGRDYWQRVAHRSDLHSAIQDTIYHAILPLDLQSKQGYSEVSMQLQARVIHSSDPDFLVVMDELSFSGMQLQEFWKRNINGGENNDHSY